MRTADFKGKAHKFCIHSQDRQLEEPLVRERNNSIYFCPFRTVGRKRRIRDGDSQFSASTRVFVEKREAIVRRVFWKLDNKSRFAFFQNTADGVTVDKRCTRLICGGLRRC